MGAKFVPTPQLNHVLFEEISFRGFPGKLKNVGRTVAAVAETAVAAAVAAEEEEEEEEESDQKQ